MQCLAKVNKKYVNCALKKKNALSPLTHQEHSVKDAQPFVMHVVGVGSINPTVYLKTIHWLSEESIKDFRLK